MPEAATVTDLRPPVDGAPPPNGAEQPPAQSQAPNIWGDEWRETWAGEDAKKSAWIKRHSDPRAVLDSAWAAQQTIAKGLHKAGLPEKPTDEQIVEYRKANGIPETPEGYTEKLPEGLVIGENDKPVIGAFVKAFHEMHLPTDKVQGIIKTYYALQDKMSGEMATEDKKAEATRIQALKGEWGPEYERNVNLTSEFLEGAPEDVKGMLLNARAVEGNVIGARLVDNPNYIRWLNGMAREVSPNGTIVGSGADAGRGVLERIAEIEKMLPDHSSAYWKGATSKLIQAEYQRLLGKQEKLANG